MLSASSGGGEANSGGGVTLNTVFRLGEDDNEPEGDSYANGGGVGNGGIGVIIGDEQPVIIFA